MLGTVKWFDSQKGYGFLTPDSHGPEVFVHYSAIIHDGYKKLEEGQRVEFDVIEAAKGRKADNVRVIE